MAEFMREPALYVGAIDDDDIDFSVPPSSGEEYIRRVVIEAQQCDDVVVANIDRSKLKKPTVGIKPLAGCVEAPDFLRPTLEWQNYQIADFSELRLNLERLKAQNADNQKWKNDVPSLPCIDDCTGWLNFCFGAQDQELRAQSPSLNIIFSMNHPMIEQVLEYLIEYVEKNECVTPKAGQWLYALLSVLEIPLNPDMCSCLRILARACSKARAHLTLKDELQVSTMNLFICLVARYFKQLDLADP